jgi:magnesium-transporting ATPase (P-type)
MRWILQGPQIMIIPILLLALFGYLSNEKFRFKKVFTFLFNAVFITTMIFIFILIAFSVVSLHEGRW